MPPSTSNVRVVSLWAYVVCVALVAPPMVPASATDACALYTSCADCTCNTPDYDISTTCLAGCAWDVVSDTCMSALSARRANGTSTGMYYSLWLDPDTSASKYDMVHSGLTTCQLHRPPVMLFAVGSCFAAVVVVWLLVMKAYESDKRRFQNETASVDRVWLTQKVLEYVPDSDEVQWVGVTGSWRPRPDSGSYRAIICFAAIPLLQPSLLLIAVGLPYTVSIDWELGYLLPVCLGASFAVIGLGLFARCQWRRANTVPLSAAYAVTNRLVVVLVVNARQRKMDERSSVRVYAVGAPTKVHRDGPHVCFTAPGVKAPADEWYEGPAPPAVTCRRVCFNNLSDEDATAAVTALLQLATPRLSTFMVAATTAGAAAG